MVCFVCLQIADVAFEPLGIGQPILKIVIAIMLLALPIVTYIAWVFDVSPDDTIQRTSGKRPRVEAAVTVLAVLLLGIGGWMVLAPENPPDLVTEVDPTSSKAPTSQIRSLAVLPLDNLSGDPEQEYVADGMTAALIDELGQLGSLKVISRLSVMRYKHSDKSMQEIASELGVPALIGGTVSKDGSQFRVTAELIDANNGTQIWNGRFDSEISGVLKLHADVARAVVEQIQLELTPREEKLLATSRPVDPAAYDAFQKGEYHLETYASGNFVPGSLEKSTEYFREAITLDPDWALAHAGLAAVYHFRGGDEFYRLSKAAALKALELDDELVQAYGSLAYVLFQYDHDWAGAEAAFQRSYELNPNFGTWGYAAFLQAIGRLDEAIERFKQAEESNPNSLDVKTQLGMAYTCASQYGEAVKQLQKVIELDPEYAEAYIALGYAHMSLSMNKQAVTDIEKARELCRTTACRDSYLPRMPALGQAYAQAGMTAEARDILHELEATEPQYFPKLYLALNQKDEALSQLENAVEKGRASDLNLRCSWWNSLREEPRFQEVVRQLNLPQ